MNNIYLKLLRMAPAAKDPVLATVTGTLGSTPQKPGSSAIFVNKGLVTGTVGGGIVEWRTEEFARECARTKESRILNYTLDKESTEPDEAICGGSITILIDANPLAHLSVFAEIEESLSGRTPGVLITKVNVKKNAGLNIVRYWMTDKKSPYLDDKVLKKVEPVVSDLLSSSFHDDYRKLEINLPGEEETSAFYLEPLFPLPELIIAGAGHVGKALSHLGKMIGFEVTVIDNRSEYANSYNLPDADHIIVKDIGQALKAIEKNSDKYIVIVTRGHSDDAAALRPCIGSEAGYVGMIGSRSKVDRMRSDFILNGWATQEQWDRIYTPIGLDIKSKTIEEIALSIAAQLIEVRNSKF